MIDLRGLSLKQLRAFAGTVRHGSVTAAARELHVTPPAITAQLKLLEKSVESPLFDKSRDGFHPSEIGKELLAAATEIERRIAVAGERIGALRSGAAGSIVFGAVSTAKYFIPAVVAAFQRAHPEIRVKLVIGNRREIVEALERGDFDVLVMGRPPQHVPLVSTALGDHPHVLIASPSHRLAGMAEVGVDELAAERVLAREPGSGTRALMERLLERIGSGRPFDVVEMGTNETIKQAVIAGLGIAIISEHTCLAELDAGKLVTLSVPGLPMVRQWHLVHRADREPSASAAAFTRFVLAHRAALMPKRRL